eukprot:TRINITY_DN6795_c0_g1_i1.p2 TRINITY_DN6795_c0_g1~~TRINITY_DN6795_c0_g1_i1.p2  ORF type:complete len:240 (+),score=66.29 TRINITY_DN6795_c0_g1_i1:68-787(+)
MFLCCNQEEPQSTTKAEINTAAIAATSEAAYSEPEPPFEQAQKVEEPAPVPEPVAFVEELAAAGNPVLTVDRREGAPVGVLLDKTDPKNLVVLKINDGLLKTAAETAKKDLKAGFRVVKVDGKAAEAADMVTMILEKKILEIEFEAFEEKKVKIEKGGKPLGANLGVGKDGHWITFSKIDGVGVIPDWNTAAAPEQKVMESDKIVAIDGQEGKAEEMVKWIKEKSSMELTIYSWKSLQA